ncbi:MAG: metallophosphoesterase family protein [Planctomycetota bacterium]
MRYGIISDIHSNFDALQAVCNMFDKERIDKYLCLGDIVGYGAQPRECLERVAELCGGDSGDVIAGNHDFAVAEKLNIDFFNTYAKEAVIWTRKQLEPRWKKFLSARDLVRVIENGITLVHGTLNFPEMFDYIQTSYDAHLSLELLSSHVCFLGHSHVPVTFFKKQTISFSMNPEIDVDPSGKTLINIGSVGQPRDENPMSSCAIYDTELQKIWIRRVEYDIESASRKIVEAGLPEILGERLKYGR